MHACTQACLPSAQSFCPRPLDTLRLARCPVLHHPSARTIIAQLRLQEGRRFITPIHTYLRFRERSPPTLYIPLGLISGHQMAKLPVVDWTGTSLHWQRNSRICCAVGTSKYGSVADLACGPDHAVQCSISWVLAPSPSAHLYARRMQAAAFIATGMEVSGQSLLAFPRE